jgi:hypothetical protein
MVNVTSGAWEKLAGKVTKVPPGVVDTLAWPQAIWVSPRRT